MQGGENNVLSTNSVTQLFSTFVHVLVITGKNCGAPDVGEGADLTVLSTLHDGGGAKYTCKTGYVRQSGDVTRTCKADGSWDGEPLMCAGKNKGL